MQNVHSYSFFIKVFIFGSFIMYIIQHSFKTYKLSPSRNHGDSISGTSWLLGPHTRGHCSWSASCLRMFAFLWFQFLNPRVTKNTDHKQRDQAETVKTVRSRLKLLCLGFWLVRSSRLMIAEKTLPDNAIRTSYIADSISFLNKLTLWEVLDADRLLVLSAKAKLIFPKKTIKLPNKFKWFLVKIGNCIATADDMQRSCFIQQ